MVVAFLPSSFIGVVFVVGPYVRSLVRQAVVAVVAVVVVVVVVASGGGDGVSNVSLVVAPHTTKKINVKEKSTLAAGCLPSSLLRIRVEASSS